MTDFSFDVIVAGGGPAGICAAVAAARMGAKTALIERHSRLGGMGTSALVNNFCNAHYDGNRYIIDGIFGEIRRELISRDALYANHGLEPYNHHTFCEIANEWCATAQVSVFTGETLEKVEFIDPSSVSLQGNHHHFKGRVMVDATGDATIATLGGVPLIARKDANRRPMPLTYCYVMGPVDLKTIKRALPEAVLRDLAGREYLYLGGQELLRQLVHRAREAGDLTIQRERIAVAYSVPGTPENLSVNFGRVTINDPTDPEQLRRAEIIGKEQVQEGLRFFRKYVPGCGQVQLIELAKQIGVRESRQIQGQYCLTRDDVIEGRQFDDAIAQCRYAIDIHEPDSDKTTMIHLAPGTHYDIPLRALIPMSGPPNLIVAGRCISATQEAMSSFRVSPSVMAIGQAAGVTAALAAGDHGQIREVDVKAVQAHLLAANAILQ